MTGTAVVKETYILGQEPAPDWCRDKLMAYQKTNGELGFCYYGAFKEFELEPGDVLVKSGERIKVERRKVTT